MIQPTIKVDLDDKQLRDFNGQFLGNIVPFSNKMVRGLADRTKNRIKLAIKNRNHFNTGYLYKGTRVKKGNKPGVYFVVAPYYLKHLESGTQPHYIPRQRKNELWAMKHGMTFKDLKNIIAKHGTKPHPFTREVLMNLKVEYNQHIRLKTGNWVASGCKNLGN